MCEELTSIDHSFDGKMYFLSVSKNKIKSSVFELESYPYLICVDRDGKKIILYDASRKYIVANCFFWVGLCFVFLLLIILGLKTYYSRHKWGHDDLSLEKVTKRYIYQSYIIQEMIILGNYRTLLIRQRKEIGIPMCLQMHISSHRKINPI